MVNLFSQEFIVFRTRDYALASESSMSAASKKLARLQKEQFVTRLTKGIWVNNKHPWFDLRACVPYLLGNEQGYVSFLTVLHDEGVLSQIPKTIQVATSGHSRRLQTALGGFEFIQVKPTLMEDGIVWSNTHLPFLQASKEKALMDCLYLATRKGRRFSSLPELDLDILSVRKVKLLIKAAPLSTSIKKAMQEQLLLVSK